MERRKAMLEWLPAVHRATVARRSARQTFSQWPMNQIQTPWERWEQEKGGKKEKRKKKRPYPTLNTAIIAANQEIVPMQTCAAVGHTSAGSSTSVVLKAQTTAWSNVGKNIYKYRLKSWRTTVDFMLPRSVHEYAVNARGMTYTIASQCLNA